MDPMSNGTRAKKLTLSLFKNLILCKTPEL